MTKKLFDKKLLVSFMGSAVAILVYDGVESFFSASVFGREFLSSKSS